MATPLPELIAGTEENSLILWVGLSPSQYEELERTSKATPDQYSERFGLREEAQPALERAHYFMTWGEQPEFEPKETVLMQVEITRAGLMELTNSGVLWKLKPGQYRLYGLWRVSPGIPRESFFIDLDMGSLVQCRARLNPKGFSQGF